MTKPKTPVKIFLLRNGQKMEVAVTLGERPKEKGSETPQEKQ